MADIRNEVNAIRTAVYGEEVRSSIVNALEKLSAETDVGAFHEVKSGDLAVFEDTESAPLKNIVLYGKSLQFTTPTPDNPVEITNAGSDGTIKVRTAVKNLIPYPYESNSLTTNGVTFTANGDGEVYVRGTNTGDVNANFNLFRSSKYGFLPNGTYTISGVPTSGSGLDTCVLTVRTNDKSVSTESALYSNVPTSGMTFTCTDSRTITSIFISVEPGSAVINAQFKPMLVIGNSAADHEAYSGSVANLQMPNGSHGLLGIKTSKGGNYTDDSGQQWICDTIDTETGMYTKRIGTCTFTGASTEAWEASSNSGFYGVNVSSIGLVTDVSGAIPHMTSWTVGREISSSGGNNVQIGESYVSGAPKLWLHTSHSTLSDLKTALAAKPMTFVFPLVTPVTAKLTDEQINALRSIYTYYGRSIVYAVDCAGVEVDAYIDQMKYITDYIDKKLAGSSTRTLAAAPMRSTVIPSDEPEPSDTDESSDADTSTDETNGETPLSSMY